MAHLTAVDASMDDLRQVIGSYLAAGISNVLAIRGDPPGDKDADWVPHPAGLSYTEELVHMVEPPRRLLRRRRGLPVPAPAVGRRGHRHPVLHAEGQGGRGVRDHADVLRRRRVPAHARPHRGRRLRHPDHAGPDADHDAEVGASAARTSPARRCRSSCPSASTRWSTTPRATATRASTCASSCRSGCSTRASTNIHYISMNRSPAVVDVVQRLGLVPPTPRS